MFAFYWSVDIKLIWINKDIISSSLTPAAAVFITPLLDTTPTFLFVNIEIGNLSHKTQGREITLVNSNPSHVYIFENASISNILYR